jgi:hypothetical protein
LQPSRRAAPERRPHEQAEVEGARVAAKEGQDWMLSPAFDRNPIGVEYDPDDLVKRFKAGVPVAELVVRD